MSVERKGIKVKMNKKGENKQENSLPWLIRIICSELKDNML